MAWIATTEIKTPRFDLLPGMAVPAKFSGRETIRQLKRSFGDESIAWVDSGSPFRVGDSDSRRLAEEIAELRETIRSQEAQIRRLQAEARKRSASR